jgi:hypothetical protein
MATFKTKAQLSTDVLRQMNETGAGQAPDADDAKLIEDRYDTKLAEWRDRGLVWWTNTGRNTAEIPLELYQAIVDLMENEVKDTYGRDNPLPQRRMIEEQLLAPLRRSKSSRASGVSTSFSIY